MAINKSPGLRVGLEMKLDIVNLLGVPRRM
jgi:hypothetical protein